MNMSELYYTEIDYLPLNLWIMANGGKHHALRLDRNKGNKESDAQAFEVIFNDFIAKVGFSDDYKRYLELKLQYNKDSIEYLEKRERFLLNNLNQLKQKIDKLKKEFDENKSKGNIHKTLNQLSKIQGYQISAKDITTLQYFELLKENA